MRIGNEEAEAAEKGGGRRACETFFTDPLPPTFVSNLDNWISAVKVSIFQFTEIVLGFLARVIRAKPRP